MSTNIKRNMIQVRLNDQQFNDFEMLRKQMGVATNAEALRQLIIDRKNLGAAGQNAISNVQQSYDALEAKLDGLMWNSGNITNNMNQVAHVLNKAQSADPTNTDTWEWVTKALKAEYAPIKQLGLFVQQAKDYLRESRDLSASSAKQSSTQ